MVWNTLEHRYLDWFGCAGTASPWTAHHGTTRKKALEQPQNILNNLRDDCSSVVFEAVPAWKCSSVRVFQCESVPAWECSRVRMLSVPAWECSKVRVFQRSSVLKQHCSSTFLRLFHRLFYTCSSLFQRCSEAVPEGLMRLFQRVWWGCSSVSNEAVPVCAMKLFQRI